MDILAPSQNLIEVRELNDVGLDAAIITDYFYVYGKKILNLNETLRVSADEEGKFIQFQTQDSVVIRVPPELAAGNWNKIIKE